MDGTDVALTVLATYDISHDGRRARLAALLQSYGDRIQRSVFLITVDQSDLGVISTAAERIMDLDRDSFWLLRQCASCWEEVVRVGQAEPPRRVLYWAAL